MKERKLTTA